MAFRTLPSVHPLPLALLVSLLCALAACGGGGGESSPDAPATVTAVVATAGAAAASAAPAALSDGATPASGDTTLTASIQTTGTESNAAEVGRARALNASASLSLNGVPDAPAAAPSEGMTVSGRIFYVDSQSGDDALDGRAARTVSSSTVGPWRTLRRVAQSDMTAGDTLVLACGSQWRETLRLPASGTVALPITVTGAGSCTVKPAIDGSVQIEASAWTRHSSNVYKATLDVIPLQLLTSAGIMSVAHHPNRGYLASDPSNPYALVAADGDIVFNGSSGDSGSTMLTVGDDLALPAAAAISPGARVRVRTTSWMMDDRVVSGVAGNKLTLGSPTSYPLRAGAGYLLMGQLWMLDSPGEWHYDIVSKQLYAWLPDSSAPAGAVSVSVLALGVDLNGRSNVILDGIAIRRVGTAIRMRSSQNVRVRNATIEDIGDLGADAAASSVAVFESNSFMRIGQDAISGHDDILGYSTGMIVRNNVIRDSGVVVIDDAVRSLPRHSRAAVLPGIGSTVSGNAVINAGYIGIRPNVDSVVENNLVYGGCSVLDDCAGIYVWHDHDIAIRRNTILHTRGALAGKPASDGVTQGQGIYLDESTTAILIEHNTLIDNDHGVHIHVSANNIVRNNVLYGNRISQIWMQESRPSATSSGDVSGNSVTGNQIAAVQPGSAGLLLQTVSTSTSSFGSFEDNRYYDRASTAAVVASTAAGTRSYTVAQWRESRGVGSARAVDVTGGGISEKGYASYAVSGGNLVSNSTLSQNTAGWTTWNQTAPAGQLFRETCAAGVCLRYVAGGSPGLVSTPNFSISQGQWYRLSVDLSTEQDAQPVQLVVRRGGGGSNGYESLSNRSLTVTANRLWARYNIVFQGSASVTANNAATGDMGARVDIESITPGRSVSMANIELVPIEPSAWAQLSGSIVNVGRTAITAACPFTSSLPALCGKLFDLSNDQAVSWPLVVPANQSVILYGQDAALTDSDGDGIADSHDRCASTAANATVNADGCSLTQR